jgi:amidase
MTPGEIGELLEHGSLGAIRDAYVNRGLSVTAAIRFYIARVEALDKAGPCLNSIRCLTADLMQQAERADRAIVEGNALGPLHGIPVLLKDNIAVAGEPLAGGCAALAHFQAPRDATIVERLKAAGAIIFGKANMTEFADYVSEVMPSEFSSAGGVVKNPHGIAYGRGNGSSTGPAAAVAAGLVPVAIGSETQNSIQTPACVSSVVGYKPSVGMASRAGIIPLVASQDSPGPLARSIEDAALVASVITGGDISDGATVETALTPVCLPSSREVRTIRLGVPRRTISERADLAAVMPMFEKLLARLVAGGVQIIDPCDVPSAEQLQDVRSSVFRTEFKAALNVFLSEFGHPPTSHHLPTSSSGMRVTRITSPTVKVY